MTFENNRFELDYSIFKKKRVSTVKSSQRVEIFCTVMKYSLSRFLLLSIYQNTTESIRRCFRKNPKRVNNLKCVIFHTNRENINVVIFLPPILDFDFNFITKTVRPKWVLGRAKNASPSKIYQKFLTNSLIIYLHIVVHSCRLCGNYKSNNKHSRGFKKFLLGLY